MTTLSNCCKAPTKLNELDPRELPEGATRYYICCSCEKACDATDTISFGDLLRDMGVPDEVIHEMAEAKGSEKVEQPWQADIFEHDTPESMEILGKLEGYMVAEYANEHSDFHIQNPVSFKRHYISWWLARKMEEAYERGKRDQITQDTESSNPSL